MKIEGAPETDRSEEGERKGERVWERKIGRAHV